MSPEIQAAARRHGLGDGAVEALFRALVAGGGGQAQFNHPELGGMGQWSGGMTQIGAMFDDALKAKVSGFCRDIAPLAQRTGDADAADRLGDPGSTGTRTAWWPDALGTPSSSGAQNGIRYACFPERRRLAIERDGAVTLYDTGRARLTGFSQQQGSTASLTFSGPDGPVSLDSLAVVPA